MSTRSPVPPVHVANALAALLLVGCGQSDASNGSNPEPALTSATTPATTAGTAVAANLLQLCDHVQEAFRSGGLDAAAQNSSLASELQGMMDVAEPDAAQALRPMAEAAGAIALDGRDEVMPKLQRAFNEAYGVLRQTCIDEGSQAWN